MRDPIIILRYFRSRPFSPWGIVITNMDDTPAVLFLSYEFIKFVFSRSNFVFFVLILCPIGYYHTLMSYYLLFTSVIFSDILILKRNMSWYVRYHNLKTSLHCSKLKYRNK